LLLLLLLLPALLLFFLPAPNGADLFSLPLLSSHPHLNSFGWMIIQLAGGGRGDIFLLHTSTGRKGSFPYLSVPESLRACFLHPCRVFAIPPPTYPRQHSFSLTFSLSLCLGVPCLCTTTISPISFFHGSFFFFIFFFFHFVVVFSSFYYYVFIFFSFSLFVRKTVVG